MISNNPGNDERGGGTPDGHPPLRSFLGLPFHYGNELIGIVGVANRENGYDEKLVDYLKPLMDACGTIISGYRLHNRREQVEADLRRSEQQFYELADNINEGFWILNLEKSKMGFVSSVCEKVMGISVQALYDDPKAILSAIHPEDRQRVSDVIENNWYRKATTIEYRIFSQDGSIRWISNKCFPIIDDANKVVKIAGIAEDITEQRKIVSEIRALNAELENRVKERTQELELANEELKSFTYSVSHDLRAPLRAISGFSELIINKYISKLDLKGKHYLHNIVEAAKQMDCLITDLLEYSRLGLWR